MFGWFRPTCPVDPFAKRWIEERLGWLADEFGADVFTRRAVVLPTEEFFPDAYDRTEASTRVLLDRVCRYMDVDPERVDLEFFDTRGELWLVNETGQCVATGAAGLYEQRDAGWTTIHIESSQLGAPMDLVGTIAHELAHLRLLGEGRLDHEVHDNELLTDLTAVFHGLGIFLANSPRAWPGDFTHWPRSNVRKPEYMTHPMFGYALAHAAWWRGERTPAWARALRHDVRHSFRQGLRYLWRTGDSSFDPRAA